MATLTVGGVSLPEPSRISTENEILWSSNAGRSSETGKMLGDVIAEKRKLSVQWQWITESEVKKIKSALKTGFFSVTFRDDGQSITMDAYRGSISKEQGGYIGGTFYFKSVSASIIQQ